MGQLYRFQLLSTHNLEKNNAGNQNWTEDLSDLESDNLSIKRYNIA